MNLSGERRINASRDKVYEALNDPEILRQAIPGCEALDRRSDTEMAATVALKIGPVKAKFAGEVTLSDLHPPGSYTITGSGKGGAAGFASGSARIALAENGGITALTYDVDAKVGGKIAQLGNRLLDSAARKLADQFFTRFSELVEGGDSASVSGEGVAKPKGSGIGSVPVLVWWAAAFAALVTAWLLAA